MITDPDICVGIDPGCNGAVAVYLPFEGVSLIRLRATHGILDLTQLAQYIPVAMKIPIRVAIEKVGARPGQGVCSMFTFGFAAGQLYGFFSWRARIFHPTPQQWKNDILAYTSKDKAAAILYARQQHPDIYHPSKTGKYHDGEAEALCLLDYCLKRK